MSFRSRTDGSKYPITSRSLYNNRTREKLYQREIHFGDKYQAEDSVDFANRKWDEYRDRGQRVHLVQAMNEARNKARVASRNPNLSESQKERSKEADRILTRWIDSHKGKYNNGP